MSDFIRPRATAVAVALVLLAACAWSVSAQRGGMFQGSAEDPAIAYSTAPLDNAVSRVNSKLRNGSAQLTFDGRSGFLGSALRALDIPVDSQALVFSKTSFQQKRISETNPRALFFNDRVALGWVRDGEIIEVAAHDAREGMVFYTLDQRPTEKPEFKRVFTCLGCHMAGDTLGVPGMLMFSTMAPEGSGSIGAPATSVMTDHRSPIDGRWGGWYVTGGDASMRHRGRDLAGLPDADGFPSLSSDVVALMVLSHQVHMVNLLTRVGWEARAADPALHAPFVAAPGEERQVADMMSGIATEVVDYLLFVDEAPLATPLRGTSAFARRFAAAGPRDANGRSLHDLDLTKRLMRYPCSYEIYSDAFDALPRAARDPIYRRMWQVLSGEERGDRYRSTLAVADRRAIVEILKETKRDLPAYFTAVVR
jgi:hypothetical protein